MDIASKQTHIKSYYHVCNIFVLFDYPSVHNLPPHSSAAVGLVRIALHVCLNY